MNDEWIFAALLLVFLLLPVASYYFYFYPRAANRYEYIALKRFRDFLSSLDSQEDQYSYYTEGHLIWSETHIPEIMSSLARAVRPYVHGIGWGAAPAEFTLHVIEPHKRVYILYRNVDSFDWSSIPHYEKYIGEKN